jgi:hypothetical protein
VKWKKTAVAIVALSSFPPVLIAGSMMAHFVFLRLAFQGYEIGDLSSSGGTGAIFLTWVFCGVLLLLDAVFWLRIYRRVSN